jgi:hypothetical protein
MGTSQIPPHVCGSPAKSKYREGTVSSGASGVLPALPALLLCFVFIKDQFPAPSYFLFSSLYILCNMSSVSSHLMRRGTELAAAHFREPANKPNTSEPHGGLVALFAITGVVLALMFWAVS